MALTLNPARCSTHSESGKRGDPQRLPRELHSASQPQTARALNCVCEHLCLISIYFVHPLAKCILRIQAQVTWSLLLATEMCYFLRMLCQVEGSARAGTFSPGSWRPWIKYCVGLPAWSLLLPQPVSLSPPPPCPSSASVCAIRLSRGWMRSRAQVAPLPLAFPICTSWVIQLPSYKSLSKPHALLLPGLDFALRSVKLPFQPWIACSRHLYVTEK
ncbi:unnamed protein product [Nyctereutes procyonoides]|uniref:(raccoon dog) hypothetical protein n=1 Tax=Nyctereutes procyonoides TaxID=34880 RepID=A0A811ZZN1_NYCPR|nr:unnamed protein product [Nyctereutes procyonoides]